METKLYPRAILKLTYWLILYCKEEYLIKEGNNYFPRWNACLGLGPATLLKKRLCRRCFLVNFVKFLRTPFLYNTSSGCFWQLYCSFRELHYMFFYKHNAYKHIHPGISEKNKHILSMLSSLENSCSLLFSYLRSHSEAYSEPCQTSKMKLLPKIVNGF